MTMAAVSPLLSEGREDDGSGDLRVAQGDGSVDKNEELLGDVDGGTGSGVADEVDEMDFDGFFVDGELEEKPKSTRVRSKETAEDPSEAQEPRHKCIPCTPTLEEMDLHDLTHVPYRNWCPFCVKAKAREDAHRRHKDGHDEKYGLPTISLDYELLEEKITLMVAKDEPSGSVLAYDCLCKGATDEWVIKELVKDLDAWGRKEICVKTDGEPAIVAFQTELMRVRQDRTVPQNPPAYDPQGNGGAEKAVQDVTAQIRCLKLALEARLGRNIEPRHPIMKWLVIHAAFLLTRYSKGHDGMTSWRRLMKRNWNGTLAEFGEYIWAKLQLKKSPIVKKIKRGKKKLEERSVDGVWLGIYPRTGEHIIAKDNGDVIRVRTINRRPRSERFNAEKIFAILATPRAPTPSSKRRNADIEGQLNGEHNGDGERVDADQSADPMAGGAGMEHPEPEPSDPVPREFRIDQRLLDKFDYSPGCPGCMHKKDGLLGHRGHSLPCRQRLYDLMRQDEDEVERLIRSDERLKRKSDVEIPCEEAAAKKSKKEEQQKAEDEVHTQEKQPSEAPEAPMKETRMPEESVTKQSDNEPNDATQADDDIPVGLFCEDTDDEGPTEEGPPEKRQRLHMFRRPECITSIGRACPASEAISQNGAKLQENGVYNIFKNIVRPDSGQNGGDEVEDNNSDSGVQQQLKQSLYQLNMARTAPDVKRIIEELGRQPKFQLNARRRRTIRQVNHCTDVGEIYSPPRITAMASKLGLKPAWALDLTQMDPVDGLPWDFTVAEKRERARQRLRADKPLMLVACPMCGPFSSLMNWNFSKLPEEEVKDILDKAMEHIKFSLEMCLEQYEQGRLFLFEHPAGARSWEAEMIREVAALSGVHIAKFDFCQLGMKTTTMDGKTAPAKKRTTVMTNSCHVARVLQQAQCTGSHVHQHLLDGRAKSCQEYPEKFCRVICEAVKREIDDVKWMRRICKEVDITQSVETIMKATQKLEELETPPEEDFKFEQLYADSDFYDDVTGLVLDKAEAMKARRTEIGLFREWGVYSKIRREAWMKVISTKWLDINKGDDVNKLYRSRLVGRELKRGEKRDDLFAATPPLESLKTVISLCSSRQWRCEPHRIMSIDVKRAYFYAPATRPVYIKIPQEDWELGDEDRVGVLNLSLYGTRDAAMNWAATYTKFLVQCDFAPGKCSPCNFHHAERDMAVTVHGDDFTCSGSEKDLRWLKACMESKFEIKSEMLGPTPGVHQQEIRVLNRILRWTKEGIVYEPDQRHAEIVVRELGLENAKPVSTPGCRDDAKCAGPPMTADEELYNSDDNGPLLDTRQARSYRGISARLNYLAQDRSDLQYACKEAARRMARPCEGDWNLLKRIGRYLAGSPRYVQMFYWQNENDLIDTYTDSDWAGCKATCRSTSGGAMKVGFHCIKTWSTTQATVALSSAEAELYALTKGAAQTLGLMSLMRDFGVVMRGKVHTDASAAVGIVQRQGLGKLRHLRTQYLWIQDKVREGDLGIQKVLGSQNPADMMTKNLAVDAMQRHLEALAMTTRNDRARTAPKLNTTQSTWDTTFNDQHDDWQIHNGNATRTHKSPRLELFTPLRVSGSPPAKALTPLRITEGVFVESGVRFKRVDTWTSRSAAHLSLGKRWIGRTIFVLRSSNDLDVGAPWSAGQSSREGVCAGAPQIVVE